MKMIRTSGIVLAYQLISAVSIAQCSTPAIGPGVSWTFTGNSQGFLISGFTSEADKLTSTDVSAGALKQISSPIFYLKPGSSSIAWRFDLSGNAHVTSYAVYAETLSSPNIPICSGLAIANGNGRVFSAPVPAGLTSGVEFRLHVDFTISGDKGQTITLDNFGASPSEANGPLPVRFVGFEAVKKTTGLQLSWKVHEEDKLTSYEIQRSSNGVAFETIGAVAATNAGEYSFVDLRPITGKSYYRIKSFDIETRYGFSTVISVNGIKSGIAFKAFPTLVQKQITIQHDEATPTTHIAVHSEDGRMIKNIIPPTGSQQSVIDLSSAKPGLYLVRFDDGNGTVETLKIVKQ